MSLRLLWRPRIAVMELFGFIGGSTRTSRYLDLLNTIRESGRFKAVVLNIDSPGGLTAPSESLHLAVSKLAARKPVVAFISGVGASGGYLVSCAATRVIALPSAMVGSIGAISIRPIVLELLQRIGVQVAVTKSGRLKDMGAFYRVPTEEEQQKEQQLIDETYKGFMTRVAESRHLGEEAVQQLATAEVFLAPRAKELGLIDELGDLDQALDLAAELGKVPRRIEYVKPKKPTLERLVSRFATSLVEEFSDEVGYWSSLFMSTYNYPPGSKGS